MILISLEYSYQIIFYKKIFYYNNIIEMTSVSIIVLKFIVTFIHTGV